MFISPAALRHQHRADLLALLQARRHGDGECGVAVRRVLAEVAGLDTRSPVMSCVPGYVEVINPIM